MKLTQLGGKNPGSLISFCSWSKKGVAMTARRFPPHPGRLGGLRMNPYNLTAVSPTKEAPRDCLLFSFNIVGVTGRPVVSFSYETQAEAEYARNAMQPIIAKAKLVT